MENDLILKVFKKFSWGVVVLFKKNIVYINRIGQSILKIKASELKTETNLIKLLPMENDFIKKLQTFLNSKNKTTCFETTSSMLDCYLLIQKESIFHRGKNYTVLFFYSFGKLLKKYSVFQDKEQFLQHIFDSINVSITVIDKKNRFIFFNKGAEKLTGYKEKEVIDKKDIFNIYQDVKDPKKFLSELKKKRSIHIPEVRLISKNKKEKWVELFISNLKKGPETIGSIGVGIDITERKHSEDKLKEALNKLQESNTQMEVALLQIDRINKELIKREGELKSVNRRLNQANSELGSTLNYYNAILNNSIITIIVTDKQGVSKVFNKGAEELTGFPSIKVVNKINLSELLYNRIDIPEIISKSSEKIEIVRTSLRNKQLKRVPVNIYFSAITDNLGNKIGGVCIAFDISAQVEAENEINNKNKALTKAYEELEVMYDQIRIVNHEMGKKNLELQFLNEELRKTDKFRETIIQNISHELRTPLTSIIGFSDILLRENIEFDNEAKEMIRILNRNAVKLLKLINNFLNLSFLAGGKIRFNFQKTDLVQIVKDSINSFIRKIEEKGINVSYSFEAEPFFAEVDSDRITEVIDNILGNAIKFSKQNSRIKILLNKTGDNFAEIIIEDTGIGIAKENLKNIFDRFYTTFEGFSKEYSGLGLGLSIVKEIVDKHKGSIQISSQLGKGTSVTVKIPIKQEFHEKNRNN
ncbi:MAG: PAS domain-containing sensor histidine kinase [bacterium]|nr:PAS domain-containing sensor histidine kinase [bacterium]